MRKTFALLTILTSFFINAQDKLSYNSENEIIEFHISKKHCFIQFNSKDKTFLKTQNKNAFLEISENTALLDISDKNGNDFSKITSSLKQKSNNKISNIEPVLVYKDGVEQVCNGELIIKINPDSKIQKMLEGYTFTIKDELFTKNQFLVKIEDISTNELFELVNILKNNKGVDFVEPNFTRFLSPHTSDPYFNSQWSINNQAYLGGTIDADMDVDEAWSLSTGQNIKVAIIDEGVDLNHPDLKANLLSGYDATGNNSNGAPFGNDAHGTSCAGIVAAVANNNIGVSGIAYHSKIIPVRIAYGLPDGKWKTDDSWIINGINWAVQNGADVLSNSWGRVGSTSIAITNAINNAIDNGRGGKGCVVLFSSGNNNGNVSYPANLSNVIAVGASSMCDQRKSPTSCDEEFWWGSNYGNEISVVAPGVKIVTTDISGSSGYDSGDYKFDFNGTSSACPNAAGVAALVLSINPNFSQNQVREIIEKSANKVGNYNYSEQLGKLNGSWNNEVGYGRINALKAVQLAKDYDLQNSHFIMGTTQLTPGYSGSYKLQTPYVFATNYVWNIPNGCKINYCWGIIQGQGTSEAIIRAGSTGVFDITCSIYNGSILIDSQYITVNVQDPYSGGGGNDPCGNLGFSGYVIYPPKECDTSGINTNNSSISARFKNVVVFDVNGQKMLETQSETVDISSFASGIYIVKAELNNGEILTQKIIR